MDRSFTVIIFFQIFTIIIICSTTNISAEGENPYESTKSIKLVFVNATKRCTAKLNILPAMALEALYHDNSSLLPPSEDSKCYILCILQEFGLMDENANYNKQKFQNITNSMPKSRFVNIITTNLENCIKKERRERTKKKSS
ncbi:uncharacterized protein LOC142331821 isoform X2 [Lycorma delicatula]|uniref:uncharacterized protein LOC142331821 isoform X2 n=1 Tax=Lycorma delicatula TaxID=130591 RepID=UPI003F5150BD